MPSFNYNRDIPDANNNPSVDQPNMKTNTNSTDDLINVDHWSFQESNRDGYHRQVHMVNQGAPGLGTADGCLYADQVNAQSYPIWQNGISTIELISFPVTLPVGPDFTQGVVPLAGKMIMQFGSVDTTANGDNNPTNVSFITPFPNQVCNISVTPKLKVFQARQSWGARPQDLTQFRLFTDTGVPLATTFYWQAIGF